MEVIQIQVKPREEKDTVISIGRDNGDESSTSSRGKKLNDKEQSAIPSEYSGGSTSPKQTKSEDPYDSKIQERKTSLDSIETYSLPDSIKASVSDPNLALSKSAWVEIPIDEGNDVYTTTKVKNFSDDDESQNDENDEDNEKGGTSDASVQVDLGNQEVKGGSHRDNRIILSPGSLPSGVDVGTNTSFLNFPKKVPAKRKKRNFKNRMKRGVYVIPCDDLPTNPSAQNGPNSCSNPSADAGVIRDNNRTERQRNDNDPVLEQTDDRENKTYFDYLFESFFWLALCPKRVNKDAWIGNWIPFIILSTAAILDDAIAIKDEYIWTEDVLLRCVGIGLCIIGLIFRLYFVYMIIFKFEDIKKLVCHLSSVSPLLPTSKVIAVVVLPVASSILIAVLFSVAVTVAAYDGLEYNIEDLFLWRAYRFSQAFFLWNREDRDNQTSQIFDQFEENDVITPKETFMGITGFFIQIPGNLFRIITRDISIVVAASYVTLTTIFVCLLNTYQTNPTEEECNRIWQLYKTLRTVTTYTKKAFGVALLLLHVEDVFLCVDCLFESTFGGEKIYVSLLRVCVIVKVAYFYITAAIVYRVNAKFKNWILKNFPGTHTLFVEKGQYLTAANALEQLKAEPIVIGSSLFHINDSFLGKFVAYVFSAFLFFVDHNK